MINGHIQLPCIQKNIVPTHTHFRRICDRLILLIPDVTLPGKGIKCICDAMNKHKGSAPNPVPFWAWKLVFDSHSTHADLATHKNQPMEHYTRLQGLIHQTSLEETKHERREK